MCDVVFDYSGIQPNVMSAAKTSVLYMNFALLCQNSAQSPDNMEDHFAVVKFLSNVGTDTIAQLYSIASAQNDRVPLNILERAGGADADSQFVSYVETYELAVKLLQKSDRAVFDAIRLCDTAALCGLYNVAHLCRNSVIETMVNTIMYMRSGDQPCPQPRDTSADVSANDPVDTTNDSVTNDSTSSGGTNDSTNSGKQYIAASLFISGNVEYVSTSLTVRRSGTPNQ